MEDKVALEILSSVTERQDELARLAEELIAAPSFNPPGDVTSAVGVARRYLDTNQIPYRICAPVSGRENIIATVDGGRPGTHVVLNAHLDVFPIEPEPGDDDEMRPLIVRREGDQIYGRGAVDMKGGAAAFLLTFAVLSRHASTLNGKVTLCLVCDEESLGPFGSRYLIKHYPDVIGDVLLSSEPSSLKLVRFGEKGIVVGKAVFRGEAGHAAYPQTVTNAISRAARFVDELPKVIAEVEVKDFQLESDLDGILGDGIAAALQSNVLNVGRIAGGVRHNMVPRVCVVDVDVRTPIGVDAALVAELIRSTAATHGGEYVEVETTSASFSDTAHPLFAAMTQAVKTVTGDLPQLSLSLGATDCRFWRSQGVPAAVFGLHPASMAADVEYLSLNDLVAIAKVHALTCVTLLQGEGRPSGDGALKIGPEHEFVERVRH